MQISTKQNTRLRSLKTEHKNGQTTTGTKRVSENQEEHNEPKFDDRDSDEWIYSTDTRGKRWVLFNVFSIKYKDMTYGLAIWGSVCKTQIQRLQVAQNKILHQILNATYRNDIIHLDLNIRPILQVIKNTA